MPNFDTFADWRAEQLRRQSRLLDASSRLTQARRRRDIARRELGFARTRAVSLSCSVVADSLEQVIAARRTVSVMLTEMALARQDLDNMPAPPTPNTVASPTMSYQPIPY